MTENKSAGAVAAAPASHSIARVIPLIQGHESVRRTAARSNENTSNSGHLDTRSAVDALSRERLSAVEFSVALRLVALSSRHGEAWPRATSIASAIGRSLRNVHQAIAALHARELVTSRVVDVGGELPNGQRVHGRPVRVYRVQTSAPATVIGGSHSDRTIIRNSDREITQTVIGGSSPLNDLDLEVNDPQQQDLGESAVGTRPAASPPPGGLRPPAHSPAHPPGREDDASSTSSHAAPVGAALLSASMREARGGEPDAPASTTKLRAAAERDGEPIESREHERAQRDGAARALGDEPRTHTELRAAARTVVARWRDLVPESLVGPAIFTGPRLDAVVARLGDGYRVDELVELVEHAAASEWHREHPPRLAVRFLFRSTDRVAELLAVARKTKPKKPPKPKKPREPEAAPCSLEEGRGRLADTLRELDRPTRRRS